MDRRQKTDHRKWEDRLHLNAVLSSPDLTGDARVLRVKDLLEVGFRSDKCQTFLGRRRSRINRLNCLEPDFIIVCQSTVSWKTVFTTSGETVR